MISSRTMGVSVLCISYVENQANLNSVLCFMTSRRKTAKGGYVKTVHFDVLATQGKPAVILLTL